MIDPADFVDRSPAGAARYRDRCGDCGQELIRERTKLGRPCHSCAMKRRATHGLTKDPVYLLLLAIKKRCYCVGATHYAYYGGRGITVCDEWLLDPRRFVTWAKGNGWAPGRQIDRIDNNGPYSPENCRFVTPKENSQNRRPYPKNRRSYKYRTRRVT